MSPIFKNSPILLSILQITHNIYIYKQDTHISKPSFTFKTVDIAPVQRRTAPLRIRPISVFHLRRSHSDNSYQTASGELPVRFTADSSAPVRIGTILGEYPTTPTGSCFPLTKKIFRVTLRASRVGRLRKCRCFRPRGPGKFWIIKKLNYRPCPSRGV